MTLARAVTSVTRRRPKEEQKGLRPEFSGDKLSGKVGGRRMALE